MKKIFPLILVCLVLILPFVLACTWYCEGSTCWCDTSEEMHVDLESSVGNVNTNLNEEKPVKDLTEDQAVCKNAHGCWDEKFKQCRDIGYIKNETYCGFTGKTSTYSYGHFINQSLLGEACSKDYECISNICLNGICIDREEEINMQVDARVEEIKSDIVYKIDEGLEQLENMENLSVNTEYGEVEVNKNLIEQVLNWVREIFK